MAIQPKTPLKAVISGSNFHRKFSLYQRIKLYWSEPLESHIRNFQFRGVGLVCPPSPPPPPPPMGGYVKYIIMYQI